MLNTDCTRPTSARKSRPFAALPHELRKDPALRGKDKAILLAAALLEYARDKPSCWPSNARLALDLGCCPRTVQLALRDLQRAGWVRVELGADNPTGRLIVLVWREADCAPPSPPVARPPATPVARECRSEGEEKRPESARAMSGPTPPAGEGGKEPDLATLHQWAEGNDPILRKIARNRLDELARAAAEAAGPAPSDPGHDCLSPAQAPVPRARETSGPGPINATMFYSPDPSPSPCLLAGRSTHRGIGIRSWHYRSTGHTAIEEGDRRRFRLHRHLARHKIY
jgi:Helix-turn-helix domain